jgi:GR25 family glycosyltransferase involved in LPS biosynthesis
MLASKSINESEIKKLIRNLIILFLELLFTDNFLIFKKKKEE